MTEGIRRSSGAVGLFAVIALGVVAFAFRLGYWVADAGNSDGIFGIQEVLRGCAVAGVILVAAAVVGCRFARRLDPEVLRRATSVLGWVILVPALLWTLFLIFIMVVTSGGHEPLLLEDTLPIWAIFAVPMFLASALLFAAGHRRPR